MKKVIIVFLMTFAFFALVYFLFFVKPAAAQTRNANVDKMVAEIQSVLATINSEYKAVRENFSDLDEDGFKETKIIYFVKNSRVIGNIILNPLPGGPDFDLILGTEIGKSYKFSDLFFFHCFCPKGKKHYESDDLRDVLLYKKKRVRL